MSAETTLDVHLKALRRVFPGAGVTPLPDGTSLVTIPKVDLPSGWNQQQTSIRFLAPVGYPAARPDCFWADATLSLAGGGAVANAGQNPIPHGQGTGLWFSWHLQSWDPLKDSFLTWMRAIEQRLSMLR